MRVLVAANRSDVRWALRTAIGAEPGLTLVGETSETESLLAQTKALHPDLVLLDWELPGQPVAELLPALRVANGLSFVVVLGVQPEAEKAALAAGADAFVGKSEPPERLLAVLRSMESSPFPRSQDYYLDFWRVAEDKPWRAMLVLVDSQEQIAFTNLEDLKIFLQTQTCLQTRGEQRRPKEVESLTVGGMF